ncbi:MAG: hypothetical protein ABI789_13975 [Usitatibacter sp.]
MRRAILVALGTGTIIASAAALGIGVALTPETQARPLDRGAYQAALARIEAARPHALARCEDAEASGRELCRAQTGANETVRIADLEASLRRTQESSRNAQRARIAARYVVARAACATLGGMKRDRCLITAHATRGRALLEAAAPYETRT